MKDSKVRSLVKTISWRLTGSSSTFLVAYLITEKLFVAGPIALLQLILNTILYYVHERVWNNINWETNLYDGDDLVSTGVDSGDGNTVGDDRKSSKSK